ncbi:MauE/DoxX family redox-associated membrane protein [Chitinophaga rhizophila]|uniref:MauE/DoxX family redox-associated membrane protein n=1 Tax=Chitinophaga rhizophila TaxID=2866212 RepID=UPI003742746E
MSRKLLIDILSALLVFLFIYTGISKLLDYHTFRRQLGQSPFITSYASVIVWALPLGEIIIAGLLLYSRTRLLGFYLSFFLLSLFTFYLIAMLRLSYFIPCSCGGVLQHLSWDAHIVFNIVFVILSTIGVLLHVKQIRTQSAI